MGNTFAVGATTLAFSVAPSQGATNDIEKKQQDGRGSDGSFYLYKKSILTTELFNLTFDCQTKSKKDEALSFFKTIARGWVEDITWIDHLSITRVGRNYTNSMQWDKTANNEYSINIQIEVTT